MDIKELVKNGIEKSQSGLRNRLDKFDIELLATNISNEYDKYMK